MLARERRADYRAGVIATMLAAQRGAKRFKAEKVFPLLAGAGQAKQRWRVEEIPAEWVQIKGEDAQQWMLALALDEMGAQAE